MLVKWWRRRAEQAGERVRSARLQIAATNAFREANGRDPSDTVELATWYATQHPVHRRNINLSAED